MTDPPPPPPPGLQLDPSQQLTFIRPLLNGSTVTLKLTNVSSHLTVAFKIKTTAPKQYCVRPNSGLIPPNQHLDVAVLLQPLKVEPPLGFKCRDKFLVQCVYISTVDDSNLSLVDLWTLVEKTRKHDIVEHKLKCQYLDPQEKEQEKIKNQPPLSTDGSGGVHSLARSNKSVQDIMMDADQPSTSSSTTTTTSPSKRTKYQSASNILAPSPPPTTDYQQQLTALKSQLIERDSLVAQLQQQLDTDLRVRHHHNNPGPPTSDTYHNVQVITKTIVNPSFYSPQLVLIIAIVAFFTGVFVF